MNIKQQLFSIDTAEAETRIAEPILTDSFHRNDSFLKISYKLQSSLDINTIINQFAKEIRRVVPCDGVHFTHDTENLQHSVGSARQNYCSYRLIIDNDILGDIKFSRHEAFTEDEILRLENLLCVLLYPLRNALNYLYALKSALYDPLTDLPNRGAFWTTMKRELGLAKRYGMNFSLLSLDLDHFKHINDTYGHQTGDKVLKTFANLLSDCIRNTDIAFRFGGEEFLILLGKTEAQGAVLLADRIRKTLQELTLCYENVNFNVTCSIGIATYVPGDNAESLLERADQALYRAKGEGRDRICI